MRTEEEAKYELNGQISELYNRGVSIQNISERLNTTVEYINSVLDNMPVETSYLVSLPLSGSTPRLQE